MEGPHNIHTAIILAAGYGRRLAPHTYNTPKPLLSYQDKPILEYTFSALQATNITNCIIIVGHLGNQIREYATENFGDLFNLSFVRQDPINGSAAAVEQAKHKIEALADGYFLITASDYLLPRNYLSELMAFHKSGPQKISLSLRKLNKKDVTESSIVEYNENIVYKIHEKPSADLVPTDPLTSSLIYILPTTLLEYLPKIKYSERGEKELPSLINMMISDGILAKGLQQQALVNWETTYK